MMSKSQVSAIAGGGYTLKEEEKIYNMKNMTNSSDRLKRAFINNKVVTPLLLGMAQKRCVLLIFIYLLGLRLGVRVRIRGLGFKVKGYGLGIGIEVKC